jgi:hypothetical protein
MIKRSDHPKSSFSEREAIASNIIRAEDANHPSGHPHKQSGVR